MEDKKIRHKGGCHCGALQFEFDAPSAMSLTQCNCSICAMSAYQHIFVPETDLRFICGQDEMGVYTFGTHQARHMFCMTCGVKPLYRPRSHPDSYSVNLRCVIGGTVKVSKTIEFDGQNWEKNISNLHKET